MDEAKTVLGQLKARKSVRVWDGRDVPDDVRRAILEAATEAPTAGNQQLYSIIDVRDQAVKDELAELCDHQPFIASAPMVLVFIADCEKWRAIYAAAGVESRPAGPGDLLLACSDANIAAQNAVVAAWALGVGSCYIGDVLERCEAMRELLALPSQAMPACMLVFGYPTERQLARPKPERMPLSTVVMGDRYRPVDEASARAMVAGRSRARGFESWVRAFHERKYASDFSREMSRSVALYLESFEDWDGGREDPA